MTSCSTQALAVVLAAVFLASCGKEDKSASTRVAVKVNTEQISVHQLNSAMARLRGLSEEQRKTASWQLLDGLVDQALLVQRAMKRKLDRDPRVVHAIEASKRQVLAQAYLDSITAQVARPLPEEIAKFYALHPELFAERKIYRLQELTIASHPALTTARVEEELGKAESLNEVVEWLKREKIPYNADSTVKAAEQLPMEVLPRLTALKQGQAVLVPAQHGYLIVQMTGAEPLPLTEEQARPLIEQYLTNQKRRELAQTEVRTLRSVARIEYVGDFANSAAAASGVAAPAAHSAPSDPMARKLAIERSVKGI